jgi:hypothetical protein
MPFFEGSIKHPSIWRFLSTFSSAFAVSITIQVNSAHNSMMNDGWNI